MHRNIGQLEIGGTVHVNGQVIGKSIRLISAYVQQDDLFFGSLTVREHLWFQVIDSRGHLLLKGTIYICSGRLKGISGGERKRLAFASEVLTNPPVLFCDEPTSGLDSSIAQNVVHMLKQIAELGKTVVCTIHQPSSQVHQVFWHNATGEICFLGPSRHAMSTRSPCPRNFNPADHYIRTLAILPEKQDECRTKLRFYVLFWRATLHSIREPQIMKMRLYQNIVIAILLGLVYLNTVVNKNTIQNINGVLFVFVSNMVFSFAFSVVFCQELPIFWREHLSHTYRVDTYYLAKSMSEFPHYIVFAFVFTSILYWMAALYPSASAFFIAAGINILCAHCAVSLGKLCLFINRPQQQCMKLLRFCTHNGLPIMNTFFEHRNVYSYS
ncbi:unnamed protein product [Soboliphyme baturini]|uniref:ABC transporter domain-containing protein n=1 Tax=Soboliphyme baturini TaxID=241478 RepID=A0A183IMH1_9BILA|nr:unnamed protein product [Soboliphyme baturini]